jgi:hypothetical protein
LLEPVRAMGVALRNRFSSTPIAREPGYELCGVERTGLVVDRIDPL